MHPSQFKSSNLHVPLMDLSSKLTDGIENQNWHHVLEILKPKLFSADESVLKDNVEILTTLGILFTKENDEIPQAIRIQCLKCLGNSLGRKSLNSAESYNLIDRVYNTVTRWTVDYIISCKFVSTDLSEDQNLILRLSIQFLCNLITFMNNLSLKHQEIQNCLDNDDLKNALIKSIQTENIPMINASCTFVHNVLLNLNPKYFTEEQSIDLCMMLLKPIKMGFDSAKEIFFHILKELNIIKDFYDKLSMEEKLCLWEIIFCEINEYVYDHKHRSVDILSCDTMEFIPQIFCKKSDLILKTVDTCLDDMEPKEIIILLDILGILTTETFKQYETLKNHKSLLINCTYLLKSLHLVGKESINFVTPIQKLSEIAPSTRANSNYEKGKNIEDHPAFGFKVGLIRVIGNMSYRNKICQDLLRSIDAIPLLLDCCNIDARNPLITQWIILALRNLCEKNPANQKIIENSAKIGSIDNSTLKEMGLTLNEDQDGKIIGIVPLKPCKD